MRDGFVQNRLLVADDRFWEEPPEVREWLRREVSAVWSSVPAAERDIYSRWDWELFSGRSEFRRVDEEIAYYRRSYKDSGYFPYPHIFLLGALVEEDDYLRSAREEVKLAEFLNMSEVAGQFLRLFEERGYGADALPEDLPPFGPDDDPEEIYAQLFGPTELDRRYVIPYLAALARHEWKQMDPRTRDMLIDNETNVFGTGRLPLSMITKVLDREFGSPDQRLEIRAVARICWQVFDEIRTALEDGWSVAETENDVLKRRIAAEIADFGAANFVAGNAYVVWWMLNDEERLLFGGSGDVIGHGLPVPFLLQFADLKDKLGNMSTRDILMHVRALISDFRKLTDEQHREMGISVSPVTGKPQISKEYVLKWNRDTSGDDDIDGAGGEGAATPGSAHAPSAGGSTGNNISAAVAGFFSSIRGLFRFLGFHKHENVVIDGFTSAGETSRGVQGRLQIQGMQPVSQMMFAGALAVRTLSAPLAMPLTIMPMGFQFRPIM